MNPLVTWLAAECKQNLLEEKWLLAPDLRVAQQWKDRLNLAGHSSVNLHSATLRSVVLSLVTNVLLSQSRTFINTNSAVVVVRGIASKLLAAGKLQYFTDKNSVDGLAELLTRSIQELRLAEQSPNAIVSSAFAAPAKGHDLIRILQEYCDHLQRNCLADYATCVTLVTAGIAEGVIALPRDLRLLVPESLQLRLAEQKFLTLLESKATVCRFDAERDVTNACVRQCIEQQLAAGTAAFHYYCGFGEANEVRGLLQRVLSTERGGPVCFDQVEILYTDYHQYVPLLLELLSAWMSERVATESEEEAWRVPAVDSLPITFAEGVACVYSRPGRALRGWLRWAACEFIQSKVVQLLREGVLARPESEPVIGYARLANLLRNVPIGFQIDRYLPKIREAIVLAEQSRAQYRLRDRDAPESQGQDLDRDFGLPGLTMLLAIFERLVDVAPHSEDDAVNLLQKARRFLIECVRVDNPLDRLSRGKLVDDIDVILTSLKEQDAADLNLWQWLEELPVESRILSSGPSPGCLHAAPLGQGGYSGRRNLFIIGLDDGRFPKRALIDPILLDAERRQLSEHLPTSEDLAQEQQQLLYRALHRTVSENSVCIHLSYSNTELAADRSAFPSPVLLDLFRVTEQKPAADMNDLLAHLGSEVAFISQNSDNHLCLSDAELAALLKEPDGDRREQMLTGRYLHLGHRLVAQKRQAAGDFTEFDGHVPEAGLHLDPAGIEHRVSPSRLETFGACPRRFFFKYGLGVHPPGEWTVNPEKWLDAIQFGNLVHELFEDFLRAQTKQGLIPDFSRDQQALKELLHEKIERLKADVPIPNQDALQRQCELLDEVCNIFLTKEQEYCRTQNACPWVLEASIGLGDDPQNELDCRDPISLALSDGRIISVGGRIDRVDRLNLQGSQRYVIWDYKSGSDFGYSQEDPFQNGRKLQPFLYVGMLRHRIAALKGPADAVASFGYFFPTPKTEGLRLQWTQGELRSGDEVLRQICDLIKSGVFIATTEKTDCQYCDYNSVCDDVDFVTELSHRKSNEPGNAELLGPWKLLRSLNQE